MQLTQSFSFLYNPQFLLWFPKKNPFFSKDQKKQLSKVI